MLTKSDINIIRHVLKEWINDTTYNNTSGDLYCEEREECRRALKNLPKTKDSPKAPPLPSVADIERCEFKAFTAINKPLPKWHKFAVMGAIPGDH